MDRHNAFARGRMRQHAPAGDVSTGPDAGNVGLSPIGRADSPAAEIDTQVFEAEIVHNRCTSRSVQHIVARYIRNIAHLIRKVEFDSAASQNLQQPRGDFLIAARRNLRQHFINADVARPLR